MRVSMCAHLYVGLCMYLSTCTNEYMCNDILKLTSYSYTMIEYDS